MTLRAWTSPDGYIDTRFDLMKDVKARFESAGLTFAYPHQVAVESRPWTAPDRERQARHRRRLAGDDDGAPEPSVDGSTREARSGGSTSELS